MRLLILFLFICNFSFGQTDGNYNNSYSLSDSCWLLNGNSNTISGTNFIGTTDANRLDLATNNIQRVSIASDGKVGIGTTSPNSTIQIIGSFSCQITIVTSTTTLNETHHKILINNGATNITITLPNALTCIGREYVFSRTAGSTGTIRIVGGAGNQIQSLAGTIGATTTLGAHNATGAGLGHYFTAVNIGGVGTWIRI